MSSEIKSIQFSYIKTRIDLINKMDLDDSRRIEIIKNIIDYLANPINRDFLISITETRIMLSEKLKAMIDNPRYMKIVSSIKVLYSVISDIHIKEHSAISIIDEILMSMIRRSM